MINRCSFPVLVWCWAVHHGWFEPSQLHVAQQVNRLGLLLFSSFGQPLAMATLHATSAFDEPVTWAWNHGEVMVNSTRGASFDDVTHGLT
jgi:hypothetical protein